MGAIKTTELSNGNIGLEITYGGKEAPFGGVDTSAPPAYIDPTCFTLADGFLIVDNKLVAVNFQPASYPVLWGEVAGIVLLKIGTFYNSLNGQLNYALGYAATPFGTSGVTPTGVNYAFYMTAWSPEAPTVPLNDVLLVTLFDAQTILEQASITLDCIASGATSQTSSHGGVLSVVASAGIINSYTLTGGTGYTADQYVSVVQPLQGGGGIGATNALIQILTVAPITGAVLTSTLVDAGSGYYTGQAYPNNIQSADCKLTINGPSGGPTTYDVSSTSSSYNRQTIVAGMAAAINAGPDPNVTAAASLDGYSLILTAITAGVTGNSVTVQDVSAASASTVASSFYFSCRTARNLQGGQVSESATAPLVFVAPASVAEVGGTIYIANVGPMILKYSGPGEFTTSTMYNGVSVIRKFAGSLIGLRLQNQLGTFTQNQDMIFAWTAGEQLDEWSPVSSTGTVTGAGFAELADVGDFLSGLIVTNGTAFVLRSQGISYATATGNATSPFNFNHIGLGDQGEGAQIVNLVAQYDQTGVFVGNSNVYQIASSISPIGDKIKALLFSSLQTDISPDVSIYSATCARSFLGGDTVAYALISPGVSPFETLGSSVANAVAFIFSTANGTWMAISFPLVFSFSPAVNAKTIMLDVFSTLNAVAENNEYNQTFAALAIQKETSGTLSAPSFYILKEGIPDGNSFNNPLFLTFPQEEVAFGRDVTVDSLFVSLWADVSEDVTVNFYVNILKLVDGTGGGAPAVYEASQVLYATLVLTPAQFNSLDGAPIELQVFSTTYGVGALTGHSPQLHVEIPSLSDTGTAKVRISKISMYCSFDPAQRPV